MEPDGSDDEIAPIVYIDAQAFGWRWFAGVPRYAVRLAIALAAQGASVRFFENDEEIVPLPGLDWSPDQDLERWARRCWHGERRKLTGVPTTSLGIYCGIRPEGRRVFPFEVSILHDLCPLVVSWSFPAGAVWGFERFFSEELHRSDVAIAVSQSTKADAAWLTSMPQERVLVAHSGMSLCVGQHRHRRPVRRDPRVGITVSTVEPRKNAEFLLDWFHRTKELPPDMELWWVGRIGWLTSRRELRRMSRPPGGRRVRFLGNVSDARLCRLYRRASWSIYPSLYEGFGFPVVDSLRHGTPVLTSQNSSLREFDHEGVYHFDPRDASSVDRAWRRFVAHGPGVIAAETLLGRYSWARVARTILDAHSRRHRDAAGPGLILRPDFRPASRTPAVLERVG
jgi:glycosyltransferase involved in cell wall biosynthesis